jgi:hypothetical protein
MKDLVLILIPILIQVESGGNDNAYNDKELAAGCLQIRPIVVRDINRIVGSNRFRLGDRYSRTKSVEMCEIYLAHYGKAYEKKNGKINAETLCKMWCGGPNGWRKKATQGYWDKCKAEMVRRGLQDICGLNE